MLKRLLLGLVCSIGISSAVMAGDITDTGKSDKDVYTYYTNIKTLVNDLAMRAKTQCLSSAGLVANGTQTKTGATGNTFAVVNGRMVVIGSSTSITGALGSSAVGSTASHQIYIITANSSGTLSSTEGTPAIGTSNVTLPNIPENQAMLGFVWLYATGTTNFLPGTHTVTSGTLSVSYVNTQGMVDFIPGTGSTNSLSLTDL